MEDFPKIQKYQSKGPIPLSHITLAGLLEISGVDLSFNFVLFILELLFFFTVDLIYGFVLLDSAVPMNLSAQQAAGLPFSTGSCLALGDTF